MVPEAGAMVAKYGRGPPEDGRRRPPEDGGGRPAKHRCAMIAHDGAGADESGAVIANDDFRFLGSFTRTAGVPAEGLRFEIQIVGHKSLLFVFCRRRSRALPAM
jgi:hypothetical protein